MSREFYDSIVPIEFRPGEYVRIAGIPHDFTAEEAEKVARVVKALASTKNTKEGSDA